MDHQKNGAWANCANCDEPFLFLLVGSVPLGERVGIVKHEHGRLESDAVFGPVRSVLSLVPLKAHACRRMEKSNSSMYKCQYVEGHWFY